MTCTCEVAVQFGGVLGFLDHHPFLSLLLVAAAGWGVAQVVAAARRPRP